MEERSETRKLPRGERCSQCGDRRYYLENGMRFCASNGHEIEGFVQFDIGDEEDSGRAGAVVKKQKERREGEKRTLSGLAGRSLYIEAIQLILRSQLLWLTQQKGFREELETVVRDLWDLRIRAFGSIIPNEQPAEEELEIFSSQPTPSESDGEMKAAFGRRSWDPDRGSDWPMPRMIDTIALCYLGCLLLRIPIRIGQIFTWVDQGQIPYRSAYHDLPREIQDRMPPSYTQYLKLPRTTPLNRDDVHRAILELAMSYHSNFNLQFPSLCPVSVLVQYGKLLALPLEVIRAARSLIAALDLTFRFPLAKAKIFPIDHPEVLLISVLMVATKICFPLTFAQSPLSEDNITSIPRLDWQAWGQVISQAPGRDQPSSSKLDIDSITPEQVVSMTDSELDEYFSRVASLNDKKNTNPITKFFPTENPPPPAPPAPEVTDSDIDGAVKMALALAMGSADQRLEAGEEAAGSHFAYEGFRSADDLPPTAKVLFDLAANCGGLKLSTLTRAVYMLEQRIVIWQRQQKKAAG